MPAVIMTVDADGVEFSSYTEVTCEVMDQIYPLLCEIKSRGGYYPTGDYYDMTDELNPSPEELYSDFKSALVFIDDMLPMPEGGFSVISSVRIFNSPPYVMEMGQQSM